MRPRAHPLALLALFACPFLVLHAENPSQRLPPAAPALTLDCGTPAESGTDHILGAQVMLDRSGFSPGEIDGRPGINTARALKAFQAARGLTPTGILDCGTFEALDDGLPPLVNYTISEADAAGPFVRTIPRDLPAQALLEALSYKSLVERIGERFHASPALLARLNRGVRFAPGVTIAAPAVPQFHDRAKPAGPAGPADVTIQVAAGEGALRAIDGAGATIFFAPVTSGSEHDPLPIGEWKVTSVTWMPVFRYNPDLFWDADPSHTRATIKAGPNNPVGVVWIGLDRKHYGLHGTPEPSRIGYTQSHGCVRLTNWDAARVAAMVSEGTRVVFTDCASCGQ